MIDWSRNSHTQHVDVIDGAVLDCRPVLAFGRGVDLTWQVSGDVPLRSTRADGANAVVSGLFFD